MDDSTSTNSNRIHDDFQRSVIESGRGRHARQIAGRPRVPLRTGSLHTFWGWKNTKRAKTRRRNWRKPVKRISASETPCCSFFTPVALGELTQAVPCSDALRAGVLVPVEVDVWESSSDPAPDTKSSTSSE